MWRLFLPRHIEERNGPGQWWARLPIPAGGLGPRCSCDMDVNYKPADYNCGEPAVSILESVSH
jgi:hypothetical protein